MHMCRSEHLSRPISICLRASNDTCAYVPFESKSSLCFCSQHSLGLVAS